MHSRNVQRRSRARVLQADKDSPPDAQFWLAMLLIAMTLLAYCEVQIRSTFHSVPDFSSESSTGQPALTAKAT